MNRYCRFLEYILQLCNFRDYAGRHRYIKDIFVLISSFFFTIYEKLLCGVDIVISFNNILGLTIRKSYEGRVSIGKRLNVRTHVIFNVSVNGVLEIGNNVFINDSTKINVREYLHIGDDVIIGQNVLMYDHDHDYMSSNYKCEFKTAPITIGAGTWIGSNAVILKGVSIGKNCVIGAGSIVNKDVPDNSIFYNKRVFVNEVCVHRQ